MSILICGGIGIGMFGIMIGYLFGARHSLRIEIMKQEELEKITEIKKRLEIKEALVDKKIKMIKKRY